VRKLRVLVACEESQAITKEFRKLGHEAFSCDLLPCRQKLMDVDIEHIAIENLISVVSSHIRKPDQIVHPYHFGDKVSKSTCLWLKNLPKLEYTDVVEKGEFFQWVCPKTGKTKRQAQWYLDALKNSKTTEERRTLRSKTFPGIAKAIASQWSEYILNNEIFKETI